MRRWIGRLCVLLAACGWVASPGAGATDDGGLTEFYVVSMVFSDAAPFWFDYVLDVKADGRDSVVRYIRVAPMDGVCARAVTVKAVTKRLPGVSPAQLAGGANLCSVDAAKVQGELDNRTRAAAIFDSVRFGIVATCGSRTARLQVPYGEALGRKRLPTNLGRWAGLARSVRTSAFGLKDVFHDITDEETLELEIHGQELVPELRAGRFDAGLGEICPKGGACRPDSFAEILKGYVGPVKLAFRTGELLRAGE